MLSRAENCATISVFFKLSSEAEPFAAILISQGTHVFGGLLRAEIRGPRPISGELPLPPGREPGGALKAEPRPQIHLPRA